MNVNDNSETISSEFIMNVLISFGKDYEPLSKVYEEVGITLSKKKYYPMQTASKALHIIEERIGSNTVFRLGVGISEAIKFPKSAFGFESPHQMFELLNLAYSAVVKNANKNYYHYQKISENSCLLRSESYLPCELEKGFVTGMMVFFFDLDAENFWIKHKPEFFCKNFGHLGCSYLVEWRR